MLSLAALAFLSACAFDEAPARLQDDNAVVAPLLDAASA
jgi:hypothetical protein